MKENIALILELLSSAKAYKSAQIDSVEAYDIDNSASILSVLTAGTTTLQIGHFGFHIKGKNATGESFEKKMVLKVKPHGSLITNMINQLAQACGEPLSSVYPQFMDETGFYFTHERELLMYNQFSSELFPEVYNTMELKEEQLFLILMEDLNSQELLNSVMSIENWTDLHLKQAIAQLAKWHASQLQSSEKIRWVDSPNKEQKLKMQPLWQALLSNAQEKFPDLYAPSFVAILQKAIDNMPTYWSEIGQMPQALVHNDCNPRNSCFKRDAEGKLHFCLYDWELSNWHLPHYDIIELFSFVLTHEQTELMSEYLDEYTHQLSLHRDDYSDQKRSEKAFLYAAYDFGLHRLGMYMMAHAVSPYPFLERVVKSYASLLHLLEKRI